MNARDLETIEQAIGFPLPDHYKRFMAAYPLSLLAAKPTDWEPITEWEFADNPERVIEMNRFVRAQENGPFVEEGPWPDRFFVIGEEEGGVGNYYAIDRLSADETVY